MARVFMLSGFVLAAACASDDGSTSMADQEPAGGVPTAPALGAPTTMAEPPPSSPETPSGGIADPPPTEPPGASDVGSVPKTTPPEAAPGDAEMEVATEMDDVETAPEMDEPVAPEMDEMDAPPEMEETPPEMEEAPSEVDEMADPDPIDEMEETDPPPVDDEEPATVPLSFATDIWPLWSMDRDPAFVYRGMGTYTGCADQSVCHGSENPGAQLSMADRETAYAEMIDVPSVSSLCAGTPRVVVGDPENSCLILFYVGRLGKDDLDWVDDAEIELMREWIRQGALP